MITGIPRRGGCPACHATQQRTRDQMTGRVYSVRIRHEPGCPQLGARQRARA